MLKTLKHEYVVTFKLNHRDAFTASSTSCVPYYSHSQTTQSICGPIQNLGSLKIYRNLTMTDLQSLTFKES